VADLGGVAVDGKAGLRQERGQLVGIGMPPLGTAQRVIERWEGSEDAAAQIPESAGHGASHRTYAKESQG
jgi:hypothetical protein